MAFSLKLELPSHPQVLSIVRSAVQQFAIVVGFNEEECRSIILAVDEALANIIRHAYDNRYDQTIELTCRRLGPDLGTDPGKPLEEVCDGLEFIFVDHGRSATPAQMKGRDLDDVRPGGLGIHLISQIMNQVCYEPGENGNQLRLIKLLNRKKQ
ncbi:MAG: ATP-binding protein [Acidobacteria bacterium]|nr:ATP-binding protein [Acidobacteriota bacterium]MCL5287569.1 ATP-binding protein [Acidobacteriota bacterium]